MKQKGCNIIYVTLHKMERIFVKLYSIVHNIKYNNIIFEKYMLLFIPLIPGIANKK